MRELKLKVETLVNEKLRWQTVAKELQDMLQDEALRKKDEDVLALPQNEPLRMKLAEINRAKKVGRRDDGYAPDNMAERDLEVHPTHVNQEQLCDDIYIFYNTNSSVSHVCFFRPTQFSFTPGTFFVSLRDLQGITVILYLELGDKLFFRNNRIWFQTHRFVNIFRKLVRSSVNLFVQFINF